MGRIILSICALVVAVGLSGSTQPVQPQQQARAADQPAKATEKARQQRPPVLITLTESEGERQGHQQPTESDAGKAGPSPWYDLWAQSLMALWALFQLVLTGIGIHFINETLKETRKAVADTGKATNAMLTANSIAEGVAAQAVLEHEARQRENVPAVLVVDASYTEKSDRGGEISLTLENVGRQAAIDVYVVSRESFVTAEGERYEELSSMRGASVWLTKITNDGKRRAGAIGVNRRTVTIPVSISPDVTSNCVITKGAVVYSDKEGRDYISHFFYWMGDHSAKRDVSVPMQPGTLRIATFKPYDGPELRDRERY